MNRILKHLPCNRLSHSISPKQLPSLPRSRQDVEAMLRDMAYVLHLSRSLKESMLARRGEEVV